MIVGAERGPRATHPDWVRRIRDQASGRGIPFFFKQWGTWEPLSTTDGLQILPFGAYNPEARFGYLRNAKGDGCVLDGREWKEVPQPVLCG